MNLNKLSQLRDQITQVRLNLIRARDEWQDLWIFPCNSVRAKRIDKKLSEIDILCKKEDQLDDELHKCQRQCEKEFRSSMVNPQLKLLANQAAKIRQLHKDSSELGLDASTWNLISLLNEIEKVAQTV